MRRTFLLLGGAILFGSFILSVACETGQKGDVWGCVISTLCALFLAVCSVCLLRKWRRERRILRAVDALLPAARSGDAVAQCRVADLYSEAGMCAEAYRFYTAAARGGVAAAMYQLGLDLMPGVGAPCREDEQEGIDWLSRAYEAGDARGADLLADLYEYGTEFTPADPALAHLWRTRATECKKADGG